MITAYYTKKEKYLQKGDYRKDFDVDSLIDLIGKIRIKEPVLIKAKSKDVFDFKFNNEIDGEFEYEIIEDILTLTEDIVTQDLDNLFKGITDCVKYAVKPEWQSVLGKVVYLVNSRELQRNIIDKQGIFAFMSCDIAELRNGLTKNGEIPQGLLVKCMFDGKEITECQE